MKLLPALSVISVFVGIQLFQADGFSFPSIIDDAREAMMKFSTGKTTTYKIVKSKPVPSGGGGTSVSSSRRRRYPSRRRRRSKPSTATSPGFHPMKGSIAIVFSKGFKIPPGGSGGLAGIAVSSSSRRRYSSRRRRRSKPSTRPTSTVSHGKFKITSGAYKIPTHKTRKNPSNNFLEILGKVERSILEAQASGNRRLSLTKLTQGIKLALNKRSYQFARQTLGQALYSALSSRRGKRSTTNPGVQYLQKLKNELGEDVFNTLIGFGDEKTLIFVIDDTGSMSDEIKAVRHISVAMVNAFKGKSDINYILSVFNDPNVGPSLKSENGNKFIQELNKLRAHDGGDYPELTFTGMQRAMEKGPQPGSPMFVFTDATAKDALKYQQTVMDVANDFEININFLVSGSAAQFSPFVETAKKSCGMILNLANSNEIKTLEKIAKFSLKNFACMADGNGSGGYSGKRSLSGRSHVISVDDSIEKMIISVSTDNTNPVVTLRNPRGRVQYTGKISLSKAVIYELHKPIPGRWTLSVGARAGRYHYLVRGNSKTNIDFDFYFVMTPTGRGKKVPIPISQPLSGRKADTIITVIGVEQIQTSNLQLDLLDRKTNRVLRTLTLTPRRRNKAHFLVSFNPPSTPFRFQLRGKTLAGNAFLRSSSRTIKPLSAIIRVYKAMNGLLALPRGRRMYVIMKIFNNGPTEKFDVSINDPLGYLTSRRRPYVKVYSKRNKRFIMWFKAARSARSGKAYPVAVTIKGRKSGVEATQVLNMIVM